MIVLVGKLATLVFEVEVLDVTEYHFLLSLKQIPLGFFDDCGFQRLFSFEQRNTDGSKHRAAQNAAQQIKHLIFRSEFLEFFFDLVLIF